jgi:phage baseplate assembly protein W
MRRTPRFTIPKIRRSMYTSAKYLGDAQAIEKAISQGSAAPVAKRLARRAFGSLFAQLMSRLFR